MQLSKTMLRHLLDHVFLVASGPITEPARRWRGEHLGITSRRTVMFLDRDRMLDLAIGSGAHLPGLGAALQVEPVDELPF